MAGIIQSGFTPRPYTVVDENNYPHVRKQIKLKSTDVANVKAGSPIKIDSSSFAGSLNITGAIAEADDSIKFIVIDEKVATGVLSGNNTLDVVGTGAVVSFVCHEALAIGDIIKYHGVVNGVVRYAKHTGEQDTDTKVAEVYTATTQAGELFYAKIII